MKPVTHAFALGSRVPTEGSSNRLFCFLQDCFFELKRDLVARLHVECIASSVATCLNSVF